MFRVVQREVGAAVGKPRMMWFSERWEADCPCPDCESDGHWVDTGTGWAGNRFEAIAKAKGRFGPFVEVPDA